MAKSDEVQPTFEENLTRLQEIVTQLEQGDVPLETALTQFQAGVKLSQQLQETLTKAEKTLTQVMNDDGQTADFEVKPATGDNANE
ncbi:exodeoxyribonuclease VII small subunit [Furfurilactobacillus curtus]|uniref:Exodeoxyribonuclease 7 small subunit n=1 Tax=Furfurilactobacillus curtus TaxID=1746200 RepID=A0ABQ5JKJ5_9LACO